MKENLEQNVMDYLVSCMEKGEYAQLGAVRCARALGLSRVDVSACMNQMNEKKKLLRILSRPYLYLPVFWLEEHGLNPEKKDYASFRQLEAEWNARKSTGSAGDPFDRLVGSHHSLKLMITQIKAAISYPPSGLPLLLKGATGTGKSYMAKLAFEWAKAQGLLAEDAQFVQLNCSEYANNPELLNASLFGYVKGAFTGAEKDTSGLAALADGSILFLDEVHNLSPQSQEKLFHLMDQGIYHMMGDNENFYHSKCRMIFATTEDPDQVLLRTLLRRIPILIEVPSLKERGKRERIALIARLIEQEQKRLKRPIYLSGSVYDLLLQAEIPGNIGQLKSIIQFCCVNALFEADEQIRINLHHIPYHLVASRNLSGSFSPNVLEFYTVDQLLQLYDRDQQSIRISSQILEAWTTRQPSVPNASIIMQMQTLLRKHLDERADQSGQADQSYYWTALHQAFSLLQSSRPDRYESSNRLLALASLLQEISLNEVEYRNWSLAHEEECLALLDFLEKCYFKPFRMTQEICLFLQSALELNIYTMVMILLFLYLLDPIEQDVYKGRAVLIVAHGFSTASSIADAANQLLGNTIFDAIDMPVTSSIKEVIDKVQCYVNRFPHLEELILLVDMGSLETILDGLQDLGCSIGLIDRVSTSIALEVGGYLARGEELEKMLAQTCSLSGSSYRMKVFEKKMPAIICSCASGIGTAKRLASLLESSLPEHCDLRILTVSYPALLEKQETSPLFQEWDIRCLIGTLDPGLKKTEFISVEDLVIKDRFFKLEACLKDILEPAQSIQFQENLLKNFSLYNLMSELTVLNPQKLLEQITPCVEKLQEALHRTLSSMTCIGLYIHISCMIERIAFSHLHESYESLQEETLSSPDRTEFLQLCRDALHPLEKQYGVKIPDREINYIYEYIIHDNQHDNTETAEF